MRATAFIATSLDGFIARENGAIDWLPNHGEIEEGEDYGFASFMESVDAVVMGRNTFEAVQSLDPSFYGSKPIIVLTHRDLESGANDWGAVETMAGTPREVVDRLEARGFHSIYLDGGETIQSFLREGLLQRIIITRIPVLIGTGIPLFGPVPRDIDLRLTSTRTYAGGLLKSEYEVQPAIGLTDFPGWNELYQQRDVESLPWFNPVLDADVEAALADVGLLEGDALDLGTGPGTQAIELARRGFAVTASDLSGEAIELARRRGEASGVVVDWVQDDILDTRLDRTFDLILDRGCFHVLPPEHRADYVRTVLTLLKPGGYLLLKCFSAKQPGDQGPHRFTPEQIEDVFGGPLIVRSVVETIYQGQLDPPPRALFCVMRKPS